MMKLIKDNFDLFCGGIASVIALLITIVKFCDSRQGISELLNFLQEFSGIFGTFRFRSGLFCRREKYFAAIKTP